jgi:alkylated DNA repair dioxygenase AlkB
MMLFPATNPDSPIDLDLPDGRLHWWPDFIDVAEVVSLHAALVEEIPWEQHQVRIMGRLLDCPRLSCWIGDQGTAYVYSRVRFEPRPWTPTLALLRERVSAAAGARFNSVLANRYRDGRDAMGWHADDEPELGPEPVIASLSLGATRRFAMKHRVSGERRNLDLTAGSLLLMAGATQRHWVHALPRTARPVGERVNLTFRVVAGAR